jgi:regulator of nonsense transcripts 2
MKNQQQAEREEQQRIKNLVLNYDLQQNEDQDGGTDPTPLFRNTNIYHKMQGTSVRRRFTTTAWKGRIGTGASG